MDDWQRRVSGWAEACFRENNRRANKVASMVYGIHPCKIAWSEELGEFTASPIDPQPTGGNDMEWLPIESAPLDKRVLLWWTPVDDNPYAESAIIGSVSSHEPGKYWDGIYSRGDDWKEGYKPLERITHWQPLPAPPKGEPQ